MSGSRIGLLRGVQNYLLDELAASDGLHSMGVITFADQAQVLFDRINVTDVVVEELKELVLTNTTAIGNTNIQDGLLLGLAQQQEVERALPVVFLLTDGRPTRGNVRGPPGFTRLVRQAAERKTVGPPTVVYAVGLGSDLDLEVLQAIADEGNGQRFVVADRNRIPGVFGALLGGLRSLTAVDVKVGLEAGGGAEIVRVQSGWRVEEVSNTSQVVTYSSLFLEERRDILVTLRLPPGSEEGVFLRVGVNYTNATTFEDMSKGPLELRLGRGEVPGDRGLPDSALVEVVQAQYGSCEAAERAINLTKEGDVDGAVEAVDLAIENVEDADFFGSEQRAPRLEVLVEDLVVVREQVSATNRRTARNQTVAEFVDTVCRQRPPTDPNPFNFTKPPESVTISSERATEGVLGRLVNLTFSGETRFESYSTEEQSIECLVSVVAPRLPAAKSVLSVVAVVDVSASMGDGGKLEAVQAANLAMFAQLAPDDTHTLGLVTFNDDSAIVQNIGDTQLATDRRSEEFGDAVAGLSASGPRNIAAGLQVALRLHEQRLSNRNIRSKVRSIFLFTDVEAAGDVAGGLDVEALRAQFPRARDAVSIHVFGLGAGANASAIDLLGDVANGWNGERHMVANVSGVSAAATRALSEVLEVVADPVDVTLEAMNGATLIDVVDGEESAPVENGTAGVTFRNLGEGDRRDLLVNISIPGGSEDTAYLRATGSYRDVVRFVDVDEIPPVDIVVARTGGGRSAERPKSAWAAEKQAACAAVLEARNLSGAGDQEGARAAIAEARDGLDESSIADSTAIAGIGNALDALSEALGGEAALVEEAGVFDVVTRTVCNERGDPPLRPPVPSGGLPPRGTRGGGMLTTSLGPEFSTYSKEAQTVKAVWNAVAPSIQNESPPVYVTCVIDNSASMKSTLADTWIFKLDFLKNGAREVVDRLAAEGEKHQWGLVTFSSNTTVVQELAALNASAAKEAISGISIAESDDTDLYGGLMAGLEQHIAAAPDGAVHSVLLFTDLNGEPVGNLTSKPDIIQALNETLASLEDIPVQVNTFGLGEMDGASLDLLQDIADRGMGKRQLVLNASDIPRAINHTVENLLDTHCVNLDIEFKPQEGTQIVEVIQGAESFAPSGNESVKISFPDVVLGERRDVVLLLNVSEGEATDVLVADANYTLAGTTDVVTTPTRVVTLMRVDGVDEGQLPRALPHWVVTKFDVCQAIDAALNQTKEGNRTAALETIDEARIAVQSSPLKEQENSKAALRDVERELEKLQVDLSVPDEGPTEGNATFDNALSALCNGRYPPVSTPAPLAGTSGELDFDGLALGILAGIGPEGSGSVAPLPVAAVGTVVLATLGLLAVAL
eukprot:evm.model.scf_2655.5 EVM.evm.TU.scf_2655.5   scf_2655:16504-20971(-)